MFSSRKQTTEYLEQGSNSNPYYGTLIKYKAYHSRKIERQSKRPPQTLKGKLRGFIKINCLCTSMRRQLGASSKLKGAAIHTHPTRAKIAAPQSQDYGFPSGKCSIGETPTQEKQRSIFLVLESRSSFLRYEGGGFLRPSHTLKMVRNCNS